MPRVLIRGMTFSDFDEVSSLWDKTENIGLSGADSKTNMAGFIGRNPGGSLVAEIDGAVVGTVLSGEDGRRGYLYHLAVDAPHRGIGIARKLVSHALKWFKERGIQKSHIMIFRANEDGKRAWERLGWVLRDDIDIMSKEIANGRT